MFIYVKERIDTPYMVIEFTISMLHIIVMFGVQIEIKKSMIDIWTKVLRVHLPESTKALIDYLYVFLSLL
jgi:hypothetical protein